MVAAGAGDNAAALGCGAIHPGQCVISLDTSGTVLFLSDLFYPEPEGRLHSFCHANGAHHLMGCILSAASCTAWFMDEVIRETDYGRSQRSTLVQFEPAPHCSYHILWVSAARMTIRWHVVRLLACVLI